MMDALRFILWWYDLFAHLFGHAVLIIAIAWLILDLWIRLVGRDDPNGEGYAKVGVSDWDDDPMEYKQ